MEKKNKEEIDGYITYRVTEDGKKDDSYLLNDIPKVSQKIKDFTRKKLTEKGYNTEDIETFIKYMR